MGIFYEEPSASVSFSIQWMDIAWVEVIKEDAKSSVKLAGAVFGILSGSGMYRFDSGDAANR